MSYNSILFVINSFKTPFFRAFFFSKILFVKAISSSRRANTLITFCCCSKLGSGISKSKTSFFAIDIIEEPTTKQTQKSKYNTSIVYSNTINKNENLKSALNKL